MVAEPWFTHDHFPSTDAALNSSSRGDALRGVMSAGASKAVPWPAGPCSPSATGSSYRSRRLHVVRTRTIPLPDFAVQRTAASEEIDASAITRNIVRLIVTTSAPDRTRLLHHHGKGGEHPSSSSMRCCGRSGVTRVFSVRPAYRSSGGAPAGANLVADLAPQEHSQHWPQGRGRWHAADHLCRRRLGVGVGPAERHSVPVERFVGLLLEEALPGRRRPHPVKEPEVRRALRRDERESDPVQLQRACDLLYERGQPATEQLGFHVGSFRATGGHAASAPCAIVSGRRRPVQDGPLPRPPHRRARGASPAPAGQPSAVALRAGPPVNAYWGWK